jgi:hypothetical protein
MASRFLGVAAALGFAVSLAVHVATFFGESLPHRFPALWILHAGVFLVFGPAVILMKQAPQAGGVKRLFEAYPSTVVAIATLVPVYVLTVWLLSIAAMPGVVQERPSGYVLVNKGVFIRESSKAEFLQGQVLEARGFSAIWLVFYGFSALFWSFRETAPTRNPVSGAGPKSG